MNTNDKRGLIKTSDVFTSDGKFIEAEEGKEGGRDLLMRKLTGYISYVRGENPYIFPYRVYPIIFAPENSIQVISYPKRQMNQMVIE
jgi:hypothetical protein